MRVFKKYYFNLASKIKFNQSVTLIKDIFLKLGVSSWKVFFTLSDYEFESRKCGLQKILEKHEGLEKFHSKHEISKDWKNVYLTNTPKQIVALYRSHNKVLVKDSLNICEDSISLDLLEKIVQKTSNPYNLAEIDITFEEINWNGLNADRPFYGLVPSSDQPRPIQLSNEIHLNKSIGFPRLIELEVTIEREKPEIDNSIDISSLFNEVFGDPKTTIIVVPDENEAIEIKKYDEYASVLKEKTKTDLKVMLLNYELISELLLKKQGEVLPSISPIKAIKECFGNTGFKIIPSRRIAGCIDYNFTKVDILNHQTIISMQILPNLRRIDGDVTYRGYNFYLRYSLGTYILYDQNSVERYVKNAKNIVEYLENGLFKEVGELYGLTPEWFEYSGMFA